MTCDDDTIMYYVVYSAGQVDMIVPPNREGEPMEYFAAEASLKVLQPFFDRKLKLVEEDKVRRMVVGYSQCVVESKIRIGNQSIDWDDDN